MRWVVCDKKAAIAHNHVQHDRTKPIEIDRHFFKEKLDFARYSPQSRRIMDPWSLFEDKSQEPVYGSHISVPLEPRLQVFR